MTRNGSSRLRRRMTSFQTSNSRPPMTARVTLRITQPIGPAEARAEAETRKTLPMSTGRMLARPTLTIGKRAASAASTGSRAIQTGKRRRKTMESITTFTEMRGMIIRAMAVLAMIVGETITRLAHSNVAVIMAPEATINTAVPPHPTSIITISNPTTCNAVVSPSSQPTFSLEWSAFSS